MYAVYGCRSSTFIVLCVVIISRFELVEIIMHSLNILSSLLMIGLLCAYTYIYVYLDDDCRRFQTLHMQKDKILNARGSNQNIYFTFFR